MSRPNSFVAPALDAYLAVARESRANRTEAANLFHQQQESFRRGEEHAQNMIDRPIDRHIKLDRHQVFMDEAEFEQKVMRPLEVESAQLRVKQQQFNLKTAREKSLAESAEIDDFERGTQQFVGLLSNPEEGAAKPSGSLEDSAVYWDHETKQALLALTDADGNIALTNRKGDVVSREQSLGDNLEKVRQFEKGEIQDSKKLLSSIDSPRSQKNAAQEDSVRKAHALLEYQEAVYGGSRNPAIRRSLATKRALLEKNPTYQLLKMKDDLDPAEIKEFKDQQRRDNVSAMFRLSLGDAEAEKYLEDNPKTVKDIGRLDPQSQSRIIGQIAQKIEDAKKESPEEKAAQKTKIEIHTNELILRRLNAAKAQAANQGRSTREIDTQIQKTEARLMELEAGAQASGVEDPGEPERQPLNDFFQKLKGIKK